MEVRPCVAGEVTTSSPEARNDACSLCVAGRFSLNPLNATCDVCPSHASCAGGDDITPLPGWWHSDPASIQIHRCARFGAGSACRGGNTGMLWSRPAGRHEWQPQVTAHLAAAAAAGVPTRTRARATARCCRSASRQTPARHRCRRLAASQTRLWCCSVVQGTGGICAAAARLATRLPGRRSAASAAWRRAP